MAFFDTIVRNAVVMILTTSLVLAFTSVALTIFYTPTKPTVKDVKLTSGQQEVQNDPTQPEPPRRFQADDLYGFSFPQVAADEQKQTEVKKAFLHSWNNYKSKCYGRDGITPVDGRCEDIMGGGLFIFDSLSTLYVMGLMDDFEEAAKFVEKYKLIGGWSMFEFIIRVLGGLLSAYDLSHKDCFKEKAVMYGDELEAIMGPNNGFYRGSARFFTDDNGKTRITGSGSYGNLAEVGTYQLEFMKLSEITGDPKYIRKALKVYQTVWGANPSNGLVTGPYGQSLVNGSPSSVNLGAEYDSYYEYITKGYIMTHGAAKGLLDRHIMTMKEIHRNMVFESKPNHYKGVGTRSGGHPGNVIEHLATFLPGMFAVGAVRDNPNREKDLKLADEVVTTYSAIFNSTTSHLMPERTRVRIGDSNGPEFSIDTDEYMLRPETAESIYVMWKFTGLQKYRDMAWELFQGINNSCRTEYGYSTVHGLNSRNPSKANKQESFFLAETLKYLYLTFSDSSFLPPTEYVFNTEAHPLRIWSKETAKLFEKELKIRSDGKME